MPRCIEKKESFHKKYRLRKTKQYKKLSKSRDRLKSKYFLFLWQLNNNCSRLGVTVSKKVDKRANKRNLVKRRIREFFRRTKSSHIKQADVVIIANIGAGELKAEDFNLELFTLFKKAGIL